MTEAEQRLDFKVAVLALDAGCVAESPDSECEGDLQAHHGLTQQQLRKHGLEEYLWDPRVGTAVCERHHRRHHNRREPIRLAALPMRVLTFAGTFDLMHVLERYYAT
jgi:hypothetical protein